MNDGNIVDFSYDPENVGFYTPAGIIWMSNGCCPDQPVILTVNLTQENKLNYSCQCGCGGWCTNGNKTMLGALREYEDMTIRKVNYLMKQDMYSEANDIIHFRIKAAGVPDEDKE